MLLRLREWFEIRLTAERAVLNVVVSKDGATQYTVTNFVVDAFSKVSGKFTPLVNEKAGPIIALEQSQVRSSSRRPWNQDGKVLPLVYEASASISATFTDFAVLSTVVTEVAAIPGAQIRRIGWELTDETRENGLLHAQESAVRKMVARAKQLAKVAGVAGDVVATVITDPGLLPKGSPEETYRGQPHPAAMAMRESSSGADSEPEFDFRPEEIVLVGAVEGEFEDSHRVNSR